MSTQTPVPATAAREASPTPGRARRRRTRSVAIQASVFVLALVALALAMDWQAIGENVLNFAAAAPLFPNVILVGLGNTLFYTATAFVVGLLGGILLALMRMSSFAPYRWLATAYIEFFRGVPALLVFLAFGYGVPFAFGITWPIPVVVMLALGMVAAAYIAETLRAGLHDDDGDRPRRHLGPRRRHDPDPRGGPVLPRDHRPALDAGAPLRVPLCPEGALR